MNQIYFVNLSIFNYFLFEMSRSDKLVFVDSVVNYLRIYLPDASDEVRYWIACQFALESNFGLSYQAKKNNNYDGMKIPQIRPSLNTALAGSFSAFTSLECCVIDYCYYLCYNHVTRYQLFHLELFTARLKSLKYCPDSDYIDKVNSLFNQLNS